MRSILPAVVVAAPLLAASLPPRTVAGQIIVSTWTNDGGDGDWRNAANWLNEPHMGGFPDNTQENSYIAVVRNLGGPVNASGELVVQDLFLGMNIEEDIFGSGTIDGSGTLGVEGDMRIGSASFLAKTGTTSILGNIVMNYSGLTVSAGTLDVQGLISIGDAGSNAGLTLQNATTLHIRGGLTFNRDGSLSGGDGVTITNHGTTIRKAGGFGLSEIKGPFNCNAGGIQVDSGEIRFTGTALALLNGTTIDVDDAAVLRFSRGARFDAVTVHTGATGEVDLFDGDNLVEGVLLIDGTVRMTGGGASVSGGTIRQMQDGEAVFRQVAGTMGKTSSVEIDSLTRYEWFGGEIGSAGIMNNSLLARTGPGTGRTVVGTFTNTEGGIFTQDHTIVLGDQGRVVNDGDYVLGAAMNGPATSLFENNANLTGGGGTVNVPYTSGAAAEINGSDGDGDVRFNGPATIAGTIVSTVHQVEIFGDTTFHDAEVSMDGEGALLIQAGDHTIDGTLTGTAGTGATAMNGGSLSGGTIDFDATMPFFQTGGEIGRDGQVRNLGAYQFAGGLVSGAGVLNENPAAEEVTVGGSGPPRIEFGTFANSGAVTQVGDLAIGELGELVNNAFWFMDDNDVLSVSTSAKITNEPGGEIEACLTDPLAVARIWPRLDNRGTVRAKVGILQLLGAVDQFDTETQRLTGGRWAVVQGGVIRIATSPQIRSMSPATVAVLAGLGEFEGLDRLERNEGVIDLEEGNSLALLGGALDNDGRMTLNTGGAEDDGPDVTTLVVDLLHNNGVLAGDGGIVAALLVDNAAGVIAPGAPPPALDGFGGSTDTTGVLTIDGDLALGAGGTLEIEIGGASEGEHDRLDVTGSATLGGTLRVELVDGYDPPSGTALTVLAAGVVDGVFDAILAPEGAEVSVVADAVVVSFGAACPGDIDGSGAVDFADLLAVLSAWGICEGCPEDLDGNGVVNFGDILIVLGAWGACP